MAARENRRIDDRQNQAGAPRPGNGTGPVSEAELTDEQFIRGVALAIRAEWEGEDYFGSAAGGRAQCGPGVEPLANWSDYRDESSAAILAYLDMLNLRGFKIVRKTR